MEKLTKQASAFSLNRPKSTKSKKEVMYELQKKVPLHKCTFDRQRRSWVGPIKPQQALPSRWAKAKGAVLFLGMKPTSRRSIDVDSLVKATKLLRSSMATNGKDTDPQNEEDIEATILNKPVIAKPFKTTGETIWTCPTALKPVSERCKDFSFEKTKVNPDEKQHSAATNLQAVYLKKLLEEKEKEVKSLQNQLHKANNENVKLILELDGYRGKNYDEMLKENMTNKEYLQRVSRENIMLRGLIRKQGNRVLNRLGEKEAEERHELERAERMRLTKSAKPRLC
uniref:Uncharacterized protein LOC111127357 n=1 Tax=Crassostrea virginica TaxID=6565 RepID=A0A8B8DK80_CRAVI|nr:uncharacterized protein LOC111127357 [Crassostrea virginica]XP_022328209.1 uncharacterized protein LOC111127357 [Crassostrea virginica]